MTDMNPRVTFLPPGQGEQLRVLGWDMRVLLRAEQTGGRMGLVEGYFPAGIEGPPAHRDGHDELFLVVEGEMRFQIEQEVIQARGGSTIFIPEGTLHTFKNEGQSVAHLVGAFLPGGYERYFEELAGLSSSGRPDFAQLAALAERFGTTYIGPAIWNQ